MAETDLDIAAAAFWAHGLTCRLLGEVGVEVTEEQHHRLWEVLKEVAQGKLTVLKSPADVLRSIPDASQETVDGLWSMINTLVLRDRDVATMIAEYLPRALNS